MAVKGNGLFRSDLDGEFEMVLQVLADACPISDDFDPERFELGCRPDTRKLEQLGRIDRPAAQDHLAPRACLVVASAAPVMQTGRAAPVEGDASCERVRDHLEIASFPRRPQIGVGGRRPHSVPHRHVEGAKSLLPLAVEVGGSPHSRPHGPLRRRPRRAGCAWRPARSREARCRRARRRRRRGNFRRGGSRAARSDIPSPLRPPLPNARNRVDGRAHRPGH